MQIKIFNLRLDARYLQTDEAEMNTFLKGKDFKKSSVSLLAGEEPYWSVLVHYEEAEKDVAAKAPKATMPESAALFPRPPKEEKAPPPAVVETALTPEEENIYQTLRHWRQTKAGEVDLPVFMVAHNSELMEIARIRPHTLEILSEIKGFGPQKIQRYGEEILAVLNAL